MPDELKKPNGSPKPWSIVSTDSFVSKVGCLDIHMTYEVNPGQFEKIDKDILQSCMQLCGQLGGMAFSLIASARNQDEAERATAAVHALSQLLVRHRDARDDAREREASK